MDNRDRRGGRGSMNNESLVSGNTEVWKTVLNSNTSSKKNNSLRNLNNRHSEASGETPRLGPGGSYTAWGFGASGGGGANKDNSRGGSMSGGEPRQQSNRFIALQDDDMPDYNNINNKRSSNRLIRDNPFKSNSHSQNTNSYDRKLTRPEMPVKKPLNTEAIREKTVANVEKYCSIQDIKEAVLDIESKFESRELPHYVLYAMIVVFERKDIDQESLGKLFEYLLVNKMISYSNLVEGLKLLVADVDDLACDIPQIQDYIGKVLAPLVFNSLLPLSELLSITASETEKVTRTFAKALIRLSILNKEILLTLWYQSRLKFETLLGSEAAVEEFFDRYEELEYLNVKEENQRVEVYCNCLKKSLFKPVSTENLKRIVATVVGSGIPAPFKSMNDEQVDCVFEKLSALKLVMKSEGLESKDNFMAVLYGLQAIAVLHSVPPGLLETLFSSALDAGVVDEANIMDWEKNPGKTGQVAVVAQNACPGVAVSNRSHASTESTVELALLAEDTKKNLVLFQPEKGMKQEKKAAAPVVKPNKSVVVINYREGYWSPMTQSGKKAYKKSQFLQIKKLESSKVKPPNMPKYNIIRKKINLHNVMTRRLSANFSMPNMNFKPHTSLISSGEQPCWMIYSKEI